MKKIPKFQIIAVSYKIGNKVQTAKPVGKGQGKRMSAVNSLVPHENAIVPDDDQFQCLNGQLYIKVCFGGECYWAPSGKSC